MQDNLSKNVIGNRRIAISLYYRPTMAIVDKRGQIIDAFKSAQVFVVNSWGLGNDHIMLRDGEDDSSSKNKVTIGYNRCQFMSYSINSVDEFYARIEKVLKVLKDNIGDLSMRRVACRITGTYKTAQSEFASLVNSFKGAFPSQFMLDGYPVKDMSFSLIYDYGQYQICPINSDEEVFEEEFDYAGCEKHVGIYIDTNNYVEMVGDDMSAKTAVKDVFTLSLSIERDLYNKLMLLE